MAYELFKASLAQAHDAYLIAAPEHSHEETYGKPGAPIVPIPGEDRQYLYFPQYYDYPHLSVGDWRSVQFLREFIERLKPDVVHFHHYHRVGVEAFRAARLAAPNAVLSLTFHEMMAICMADGQMLKKPSRELCYASGPVACNRCFPEFRPEFFTLRTARLKALLNECDLFIFPSEFIAERYVDWGLPTEKCVVIENGLVNLGSEFDRSQHSQLLNRFSFFGQFIDNKGVDIIFEALLILANERRVPPAGLVVEINGGNLQYASTSYLEKIGGYVAELKKIPNNVIRVYDRGPYDRQQLAQRMGSIDWVIVPSTWWEIFGLVVSEAWMFGRPVIASSIAALKERVIDGMNGFTFPARDSRSLADLMAKLVGSERLWSTANASIKQSWSDLDMLDAYASVWQSARDGKRPRLPISSADVASNQPFTTAPQDPEPAVQDRAVRQKLRNKKQKVPNL